jgi:beta-fructofuranosidase
MKRCRVKRSVPGLLLATALGVGLTVCTAVAEEGRPAVACGFHPPGMWTWDNWFAHDGRQWHAFYLQLPQAVGPDRRWKNNDFYKHVGHATSTDLRHWQDQGPAVCALSGTWNDRHIATGSVIRHEGRWWMAFTGRGTRGDGVGLAVSDDLTRWRAAEDKPLFPLVGTFDAAADGGVFVAAWKGEPRRWVGISDPYLLPERQGEWLVMVLCARVLDVPLAESGCLAIVRSRDLRHWERPAIVAWPRCFERMETPQLWARGGRWYLSFGGVLDPAWLKARSAALPAVVQRNYQNYCYRMTDLAGPANEDQLQHVAVPRGPGHYYIMKVVSESPGRDVAIFTRSDQQDSCISPPYPVEYDGDGTLRVMTGE